MPVARTQAGEILRVVRRYLTPLDCSQLFYDLTKTEAYRTNQSFRETVDRLRAEDATTGGDDNAAKLG